MQFAPFLGTGHGAQAGADPDCARIIYFRVFHQLLSLLRARGCSLHPSPGAVSSPSCSSSVPEVPAVPPRARCCPFFPKIRACYTKSQQCRWEGILRVCIPTSPGAETSPAPPQGSRGCVQPEPPWMRAPCFAGHLEREFFLMPNLNCQAVLPVFSHHLAPVGRVELHDIWNCPTSAPGSFPAH